MSSGIIYTPPASSGGATLPIAESDVTNLVTDLAAKAPLASPALTGTPTVPTAAQGTNTTQAASTAMVQSEVTLLAPKASPTFTGTVTLPSGLVLPSSVSIPTSAVAVTQAASDNSTKVATTAYADAIAALKANIASPTFTGTPAAPTAAQGTNTTQVATTAMVHSEAVLLAPLASPTLTGTPIVPTAAAGTGSTQTASTAYADAIQRVVSPLPTGWLSETFPRAEGAVSSASLGTTGVCVAQLIWLRKGMVISNLSVMVGATVAATSTHFWQALADSSRVMVACTADDTSASAGMTLNTLRTQAIATIASGASGTYTVPSDGFYYLIFNNTAGTVFTPIQQTGGNSSLWGLAPILSGTSETISTGPPAFTKTFGAITAGAKIAYGGVS